MRDKRIVVTRAAHQAAELVDLIEQRGGIAVAYPTIAIVASHDNPAFDEALTDASNGKFDWIVFTSTNTVVAVRQRLDQLGLNAVGMSAIDVAGIGPATARAVKEVLALDVSSIPTEFTAEALAAKIGSAKGLRVFLPQSNIARPTLSTALSAAGAEVVLAAAYETVLGSGGEDVPRLLSAGDIDAVTFTSSSTARNFVRRIAQDGVSPKMMESVCVACLGARTAKTAEAQGLGVDVLSRENTIESLVEGLSEYFAR